MSAIPSTLQRHRVSLVTLEQRDNPSSISFIGSSDTLRFDASGGELNNITVSVSTSGTLTISDPGNIITIQASAAGLGFAGGGTSTLTGGDLTQINRILVFLGDLNDTFTATEVARPLDILGDEGNDTISINVPNVGVSHQIEGGSGDDTLTGSSGNDFIDGNSGDDLIRGGDGNDLLEGDSGDDILEGGDGEDSLFAGSGDDELKGGDADDYLEGQSGDDTLFGGDGFDTLRGGADVDHYDGGDDTDTVEESGINRATVTASALVIAPNIIQPFQRIEIVDLLGTSGADLMNASQFTGRVIFSGLDGKDTLIGGLGNDTLSGGNGNDVLRGGAGIDLVEETFNGHFTLTNAMLVVSGTRGKDTLNSVESASLTGGVDGNLLNASAFTLGSVTLDGLEGNDTLRGGRGSDQLDGGTGDNLITGGAGNDNLRSDGGNATVTGGAGNDFLNGSTALNFQVVEAGNVNWTVGVGSLVGLGSDTLFNVDGLRVTGGVGNNTFDLTNAPPNGVTIVGGGGVDTIVRLGLTNTTTLTNTQLTVFGGSFALQGIARARLEGDNSGVTINASAFTLGSVTLRGGTGADSLTGGSRNDTLDGQAGNDTLVGGPGIDILLNGEDNTP